MERSERAGGSWWGGFLVRVAGVLVLQVALFAVGILPPRLPGWSPEARSAPPAQGPAQAGAALLWNGFRHSWALNHRLNRLGSYVGPARCGGGGCRGPVVHTAATGIGPDTAHFRTFYAWVAAPGVATSQVVAAFEVRERRAEGRTLHLRRQLVVDVPGTFAEMPAILSVLGGFDLVATADADMLQGLAIRVGDPVPGPRPGTIAVDVAADLTLGCRSAECALFDRAVAYDLFVVCTLVAVGDGVVIRRGSIGDTYGWDVGGPEEELQAEDRRQTLQVPLPLGPGGTAVAAFQGFSVRLDDSYHLLDLDLAISSQTFHPDRGRLDLAVELFFKQWNRRTRRNLLAYARPGHAALEADLVVLGLPRGCVRTGHLDGALRWRADGLAPLDGPSRWEGQAWLPPGACPLPE